MLLKNTKEVFEPNEYGFGIPYRYEMMFKYYGAPFRKLLRKVLRASLQAFQACKLERTLLSVRS